MTKLQSPDDIRADDSGEWVNNGVRQAPMQGHWQYTVSLIKYLGTKKQNRLPETYYQLVQSYFYLKHSKDFRRVIVQLFSKLIIIILYKLYQPCHTHEIYHYN